MSTTETVIRKTVSVQAPADRAFEAFTRGMAAWWPLATHSVYEADAAGVVVEEGLGGRIVETSSAGEESVWGTITGWEPPRRLAFTWHPGRGDETAQEVEVRFTPDGSGTRVELEHRGWEKLGEWMHQVLENYATGWDLVFVERYGSAANTA